ncbi:MAG: tyrosine--tRNA ligase [Clostridia bacterium]|nr:tyrosine--tRNA ligase [Clostridia bacterium]
MKNVFDEMNERGLIYQSIYPDELRELLDKEKVVCYCGFDPTADSLHVGNLALILQLVRMQKAGHTPIALVGGATGKIGDPSGRNDMRPMISDEQRDKNIRKIKKQFESFFDPDCENKLIVVDNDDWISKLSYVDFLNVVGLNMSVNKMLSSGCFEQRMENGLSFLEFNYMPMQAYDFYHLFKTYNCSVQLGGSDQWANILAGAELIRKKENKPVYCMTSPLLTKTDGTKMGKSAGGAVWLSREKTSDYDFFQYFRDIEDAKVEEVFKMLTLLPLDEIKEICSGTGKEINKAKERLAFEVTKIVRGEKSANEALKQARGAFGGNEADMPEVSLDKNSLNIIDCLVALKFAGSRGDAKKLVLGGGVKVDDVVVDNLEFACPADGFVLKKGKKNIVKVNVQ